MCVTGSGTPVVVVISGSMEPGFRRVSVAPFYFIFSFGLFKRVEIM